MRNGSGWLVASGVGLLIASVSLLVPVGAPADSAAPVIGSLAPADPVATAAPVELVATAAPTPSLLPESAAPMETTPGADPAEVISGLVKIVNDWKTLGWMAGLSAVVALILFVIRRVALVKNLLAKGPKWITPVVSAGLGAVGGFLSGFSAGGLPAGLVAAVAGLGAGLGAVGGHTMISRMSADGAAEVEVMRRLKATLAASDAEAAKMAATLHDAITRTAATTDKRAQLRALAARLNNSNT